MASSSKLWSSVGKKVLIAVTGIGLMLFLLGHLAGNLLVLIGADPYNAYAHALISNPLVYVVEAGLVGIFLLHAFAAIANKANNRAARPQTYYTKQDAGHGSRRSLSSKAMILTGLALLVFVPVHLRTFKFGPWYESSEAGVRDLSRLVFEVFENPAYVLGYIVLMALVGMHLWHASSSSLQSLGVNHPKLNTFLIRGGWAFAVLVGGGFMAIPLLIYLDIVPF